MSVSISAKWHKKNPGNHSEWKKKTILAMGLSVANQETPSSISAPGDIGVTCATFAGVFARLPRGEENLLDPIWFVWFTMENVTNSKRSYESNELANPTGDMSWMCVKIVHGATTLTNIPRYDLRSMPSLVNSQWLLSTSAVKTGVRGDEITLDNGAPDSLLLIKHENPRHHV